MFNFNFINRILKYLKSSLKKIEFHSKSQFYQLRKYKKPIFILLSDFSDLPDMQTFGFHRAGEANCWIGSKSIVLILSQSEVVKQKKSLKKLRCFKFIIPVNEFLKASEVDYLERLSLLVNQCKSSISFYFLDCDNASEIFSSIDLTKGAGDQFENKIEQNLLQENTLGFKFIDSVIKRADSIDQLIKKLKDILIYQKNISKIYLGFDLSLLIEVGCEKAKKNKTQKSLISAFVFLIFSIFIGVNYFNMHTKKMNQIQLKLSSFNHEKKQEKNIMLQELFNLYDELWPGDLKSSLKDYLSSELGALETKQLLRDLGGHEGVFDNQLLRYKFSKDLSHGKLDEVDEAVLSKWLADRLSIKFKKFYFDTLFDAQPYFALHQNTLPQMNLDDEVNAMLNESLDQSRYYSRRGYEHEAESFFDILSKTYFENNAEPDVEILKQKYFDSFINFWLTSFENSQRYVDIRKVIDAFSMDVSFNTSPEYHQLSEYFSDFDLGAYNSSVESFKKCKTKIFSDNLNVQYKQYKGIVENKNACVESFKKSVELLLPSNLNQKETLAINALLLKPFSELRHALQKQVRLYMEQQWERAVYPFFADKVEPYYPFSKAKQDLDMEDFQKFYNPVNGLFSLFYRDNVKPFLNDDLYDKKILGLLEKHNAISSYFFERHELGLLFKIRISPQPDFDSVEFRLGKQELNYDNGESEWGDFKWSGNQSACLQVHYAYSDELRTLCRTGDWAFFHLLDDAKVSGEQWSWPFKQLEFRYRVQLPTGIFQALVKHQLSLPKTLF